MYTKRFLFINFINTNIFFFVRYYLINLTYKHLISKKVQNFFKQILTNFSKKFYIKYIKKNFLLYKYFKTINCINVIKQLPLQKLSIIYGILWITKYTIKNIIYIKIKLLQLNIKQIIIFNNNLFFFFTIFTSRSYSC